MSDRRPENEKLYKYRPGVTPGPAYQRYTHVEATPADLLSAVRRGVESGTIKGEVVWRCVGEGNQCGPHSFLWRDQTHDRCGNRLIIGPVSDGGSET